MPDQTQRSDQIYEANKAGANLVTGYEVYKALKIFFVLLIAGGVSLCAGIRYAITPLIIVGIGSVLFSALILSLTYWSRRRTMNALSGKYSAPAVTIAADSGEMVTDHVAGVMATGMHAATFVAGSAGALAAPENTIILTNKNVRFVYVPLPGADVTGAAVAANTADFLFATDDIEKKYQELFSQGGLTALIDTSAKNFAIPLSDLKKVSMSFTGSIVFTDADGKNYSYGIRHPQDKEKLKQLFSQYMA